MNTKDSGPADRSPGTGDYADLHTVLVDGIRQVYQVAGSGPICLVHSGGPGIHPEYLRIPALEKQLTMVYLHPVGCGESGRLPDGDYSVARYPRFAEAVLDDLGASTMYFLGHSHGGCVGLELGLQSPGRLDGLILYSTTPVYGPEVIETATKNMEAFVRRFPNQPEAAEAGRMWTMRRSKSSENRGEGSATRNLNVLFPAYFADFWKTTERLGARPTLRIVDDPNRLPYQFDIRGRLGEIDVPTLVTAGTYDFICPPAAAREIHAGLPQAQLREFADSGHCAHVEEPEAFAAAVLDFVAAVAPTRN